MLAIRELFPASEAYWRIPALLLFSGSGMALGGWIAGALYDHFGTYAPAFAAGVAANVINLAIIGVLVFRQRSRADSVPIPKFAHTSQHPQTRTSESTGH